MAAQRPLKKSEFLEVRLPYPTKQAFMDRCRTEGRSASETVRGFIDAHLEGRPRRRTPGRTMRLAAAAAALIACGLAAAPSFARTTVSADFARLDVNHDGHLNLAEFQRSATVQITLAPAPDAWLRQVGLASAPSEPVLDIPLRREVMAAAFAQIDADRNGSISLSEYRRFRRA